jgi:hypothetical protein
MKNIPSIRILMLSTVLLVLTQWACTKDDKPMASDSPSANAIAPGSGPGGEVLTLTGSGLGDIRTIVFSNNSVPANLNPNFNTDAAVIFRVPDTAFGGPQKIILTNSLGKSVEVDFEVIALPTISSVSLNEFSEGTEITFTGNNLETVTSVIINGEGTPVTIVSFERKKLVIMMPASGLKKVKLDITNASGTITTNQEFYNVDQAFQFFTEDFGVTTGGQVQSWSWCTLAISDEYAKLGSKSLKATYGAGAWQGMSLYSPQELTMSDYSFMTFWVKGGTADVQLNMSADNVVSGSGSTFTITIPADVWTYFRVPIAGWVNGVVCARMNFQMQGPDGSDQTVFFDNILLVH